MRGSTNFVCLFLKKERKNCGEVPTLFVCFSKNTLLEVECTNFVCLFLKKKTARKYQLCSRSHPVCEQSSNTLKHSTFDRKLSALLQMKFEKVSERIRFLQLYSGTRGRPGNQLVWRVLCWRIIIWQIYLHWDFSNIFAFGFLKYIYNQISQVYFHSDFSNIFTIRFLRQFIIWQFTRMSL